MSDPGYHKDGSNALLECTHQMNPDNNDPNKDRIGLKFFPQLLARGGDITWKNKVCHFFF